MTEVTLKVLPAPEATATLMLYGLDAAGGVDALCRAMGSPFDVTGTAFLPVEAARVVGLTRSAALIRVEEFATFVQYRVSKLRALFSEPSDVLDDTESRRIWRAVRDAAPLAPASDHAVWRASCAPTAGAKVASAMQARGLRFMLDWSGGLVWLAGPPDAATHAAVTGVVQAAGGTWMLMRAPPALRAAVPVVPPEPAPLAALTRRVKAAMDPRGVFNPGRIFAGI
jgi:glycolate oxidase FAD binding subunit